jgi:thioredoxin 1
MVINETAFFPERGLFTILIINTMKKIIDLSFGMMVALFLSLIGIVLLIYNAYHGDKVSFASKDGIQFSAMKLQQAEVQSKIGDKPIFLLAHASYCSACKKMIRTVFPEKEIGDLFNKRFINVQVDIESEEGKKVVKNYEITGTPTLLFLTANGKVINKVSGFQSKDELISLAKGLTFQGRPVSK